MTKRAILWCGHVRPPLPPHRDPFGIKPTDKELRRANADHFAHTDDASIQANGLELAFKAALALAIPHNEIHACVLDEELLPRDFDRRCFHAATVTGLRYLVRNLMKNAKPDDALLFIAVNHSDENALATADPVDEFSISKKGEQLTPTVLKACLSQLPGPQVVIVSTCYSGIFLEVADDRRVVFTACAADKVYRVSRQDCKWPTFLDELFGAWCACAFSDAIPLTKLALDTAFLRAQERLSNDQKPLCAGTAVWPT